MITHEEFQKMYPMSSEKRVTLYPELDNDAFIKFTNSLLQHVSLRRADYDVPTTYEEDVIYFCVPELIRRLEQATPRNCHYCKQDKSPWSYDVYKNVMCDDCSEEYHKMLVEKEGM